MEQGLRGAGNCALPLGVQGVHVWPSLETACERWKQKNIQERKHVGAGRGGEGGALQRERFP